MTGRRRRDLRPDERRIWEAVTQSVTPLSRRRLLPDSGAVGKVPRDAGQEAAFAPLPLSGVEAAPPVRAPAVKIPPVTVMPRRERRAIVRGSAAIDAKIDLHGMRQAEAAQALKVFLHRSFTAGRRTVLVVTGKGNSQSLVEFSASGLDGGRGVLRRLTPFILESPELRHIVLGFEMADPRHGGEGALYVRLRRKS